MAGAAKKKAMGAAKTRTGKTPMPKKGMVKKSVPAMPKGSGQAGSYGGGQPRTGGY